VVQTHPPAPLKRTLSLKGEGELNSGGFPDDSPFEGGKGDVRAEGYFNNPVLFSPSQYCLYPIDLLMNFMAYIGAWLKKTMCNAKKIPFKLDNYFTI